MTKRSVATAAAAAKVDDGVVLGAAPPMTDAGLVPGASQFEPAMPIDFLQESPNNPRKRFRAESMRELEESVRAKGVVTPLLVRRAPGRAAEVYEIAAGHRRYRAAVAAGRPTVPVLIREMEDAEFLELLVMENDQREDVHALEEASGYQALLGLKGYDVAKIAARVGRSPKYVYDRLKLLELVPDAQALFLRDLFSAGHAILLARLKPEDQKRAIEATRRNGYSTAIDSGVFQSVSGALFDDDEPASKDPYAHVKAVSVRELEAWIQRNVRFEPAHVDAFLFPETAQAIEAHADDRLGVILGTRQYRASDDVRGAGKEKVFGAEAWKRADGQEKSKTCDWSRLLLIACGPGQGETFLACVAKQKCTTHWAAWQKERKASASGSGSSQTQKPQERQRREDDASKLRAEQEEILASRWEKATPAMLEALAAAVKKAPVKPTGQLAQLLVRALNVVQEDGQYLPIGNTPEDLVRHLAFAVVATDATEVRYQWGRERWVKQLRAFGIDPEKILAAAAPVEKVQTPAKEHVPGPGKKVIKGTCRKCGCTEEKACAAGCAWADGTQTRCTACFPPKLSSSAKGKKKARR
jgi:ParB/RepB/Spo0J family partition protein